MLLQTNSYIVPKDKRGEHSRLLRRFRQTLLRLGCTHFECYEQVGTNWSGGDTTGRFVQIMRFIDRKHQLGVQSAERSDPIAQQVISEFCELINYPYQQQQGLFAVGFYTSVLPVMASKEKLLELPGEAPPEMEDGTLPGVSTAADEIGEMDEEDLFVEESLPPASGPAESLETEASSEPDTRTEAFSKD